MKHKPLKYYKGNTLKQLRAFCSVARTGKMTEAADELFLSQSAVSLQIKALEEEMEVVLFERRGPKIRLTPDGEKLLDMALPLVDGMDGLKERYDKDVRGDLESGKVVIAASESAIMYIVPKLISTFRERHPKIRVELRNVTGRKGLTMIRRDKVDFAIGSIFDVPGDISYTPLYSFDPALIMPIGHALAEKTQIKIQALAPYGLILPPRRLTTWGLVDRVYQQHGIPFNVVLEVGGWEVIKRYVALDFGISITTGICLRKEDPLVSRRMNQYFPKRSYGIVQRQGRHLSLAARAFLDNIEGVSMPDMPYMVELGKN